MLQKPVSLKLLEAEFVCQCNYPEAREDEGQSWQKDERINAKDARPLRARNHHQVRRGQG
jgi:hypothetical protein